MLIWIYKPFSNCLKENLKEMKNLSRVPDGRLSPRRTGRLIVGRNVTLTLTNPTCRQRRQTLGALRWRGPAATLNYRPVLTSERALQNNKPQLSKRKYQGERKIGCWSQMDA
jgi:hypothetical protein